MWWNALLVNIGLRVARKTIRDDRENLVNKLTKGSFTPLQQVLINVLISKIIDKYIEEESILDYIPGNYFRYVKKLKIAKKLIESLFALINIVKCHKRDTVDFSISYVSNVDKDIKYKNVLEIKENILTEVEKLIQYLDLQTGSDLESEEINILDVDINKSVKMLL